MAIDEILIDAGPGEVRAALLQDGRLCDLVIARGGAEGVAGNIYLGRVERVVPSIQAAFVEIGLDRPAFLGLAEARPPGPTPPDGDAIGDYVSEGDALVVQAAADPVPGKGARVTTRITLPGRYVVYTPDQPGVVVSRRIADDDERGRLGALLSDMGAGGFIVRTAAAAADDGVVQAEAETLEDAWAAVCATRDSERPPACLRHEADPVHRALRDGAGPGVRRIVVDGATILARLEDAFRQAAPELAARLERHSGHEPLFEARGIEDQIDAALASTVSLAGGGSIVVSETPALVAIDVNTGGGAHGGKEETALKTNLEAADEIARQLRLRDLGGLVAIDFVAMKRRQHGADVVAALRRAVGADPMTPQVAGYTRFGLVELTRRRQRASLGDRLAAPCPLCAGGGRIRSPATVALQALRAALREARANPAAPLAVTAAPAVVEALSHSLSAARAEAEERLGRPLRLVADPAIAPDRFAVGPVEDPDHGRG